MLEQRAKRVYLGRFGPPTEVRAKAPVSELSIEAVVIRADGTREDLGIVSYWHKNPLRRLAWRVRRAVRRN
jgi:hypothetical protein